MKGDDIRSAICHRFHIRISFQFRAVLPCAMFLLVLHAYVFLGIFLMVPIDFITDIFFSFHSFIALKLLVYMTNSIELKTFEGEPIRVHFLFL